MKRISARLIIFILCFMLLPFSGAAGIVNAEESTQTGGSRNYPDIAGHWAEKSIEALLEKGYVKGIQVGGRLELQPDKPITRAEFISLLSRCKQFELAEGKAKQFSDVKKNAWFKEDLDRLSGNSIVKGGADGTFRPELPVTRAEIAAMISRAYGLETSDNIGAIAALDGFKDVSPGAWYYESVMVNKLRNVINGNPDGRFAPMRNATRAEAMTILARLIDGSIPAGASGGNTGEQEPGTGNAQEPGPSITPGPTPAPTPAVSPMPTPAVSPTPTSTPVNNPSGLIGYNIQAGQGVVAYYQIYSFGMKELGKFTIRVNYDPAFAKAVNIIAGTIKPGNYIDGGADLSTAEQGYITVSAQDGSVNANESGTIFTVAFEIREDASGSTDVTLTSDASDGPALYNTGGGSIQPLSVKNGSITLK